MASGKRPPPKRLWECEEETPDCYLFYFPEERCYSLVKKSSRALPKEFSGNEEYVSLCSDGEYFNAKLVASGTHSEMNQKMVKLETRLQENTSLSSSFGFLDSTTRVEECDRERRDIRVITPEIGSSAELIPADNDENKAVLRQILHTVNKIQATQEKNEAQLQKLQKDVRRLHRKESGDLANQYEAQQFEPVIFNGEDLTQLRASRPSIYGLLISQRLFSNNDLSLYRISPQKRLMSGRPTFPEEFRERLDILKRAVLTRFPNGWEEAKSAINQKGLDIKAKKK